MFEQYVPSAMQVRRGRKVDQHHLYQVRKENYPKALEGPKYYKKLYLSHLQQGVSREHSYSLQNNLFFLISE